MGNAKATSMAVAITLPLLACLTRPVVHEEPSTTESVTSVLNQNGVDKIDCSTLRSVKKTPNEWR